MITEAASFRVYFPADYDSRGEWEVESKGWLHGVRVEGSNGDCYPLFFYDPVRMAQDLEADTARGRPLVAEPGLVVIPVITRVEILRAIERLVAERFFDHLRPLAGPGPAEAVPPAPADTRRTA